MTDRLAELGALQYAVENLSTAGTNPNRLGLAGYIHAAYTDYQAWAAANPGVNPNRLSAKGRLYGYFYDHASWSPLSLFASSEIGAWYDPSDLTTMFQDRAGTTPVTADGQTVGLILDKSKGLALGSELVTNGDFSSGSTGWTLGTGWSIADGKATANTTMGNEYLSQTYSGALGVTYLVTAVVTMLATPNSVASVGINIGGNGEDSFCNTQNNLISGNTYYITNRVKLTSATSFILRVGSGNGLNYPLNFTIDNISVKSISGNHAVAPSDAARPLYKTDGTYHWLQFDGVDDSLSTAAINFTATDKMSAFSGINKVGTSTGIITELSASADSEIGSFAFYGTNTEYYFYPRGTNGNNGKRVFTFASPIKNVIAFELDMSLVGSGAGVKTYTVNGTVPSSGPVGTTSLAAGGNFGTWPIYIGRRGGTAYSFSGNIYSLIVRGSLSTTDEITATETWINSKTGAY